MTITVAVQWAHEIAGEIASDIAKPLSLAVSLIKSFDAPILEQTIALEDKTDRYEDTLNAYLTHSPKYKNTFPATKLLRLVGETVKGAG